MCVVIPVYKGFESSPLPLPPLLRTMAVTMATATYKYVDFIHNDRAKPIIETLGKALKANIIFLPCKTNCSGPKEEEAIKYFSTGAVDFGRM